MRLAAFDLDGTLVDSSEGIQMAIMEAVSIVAPYLPFADFRSLIGPPMGQMLLRAYPQLNPEVSHSIIAEYRRIYDTDRCRYAQLYNEVAETLICLRQRSIAVTIMTNKPIRATKLLLEHLGVSNLFDAVATIDSAPVPVPKTEMLRKLLADFSVEPGAAFVVGDSSDDGIAARECRCAFFAVSYGFGSAWNDPAIPRQRCLQQFGELLAAIEPDPHRAPS